MMEHRAFFTLLLLCISLPFSFGQMIVGQDTLVGNEWIHYSQKYYKFSVDQDGVYRIPKATLQSAGISDALATGANFRLYNKGKQVPLFVSTDGQFGDADFIEFYGYRNRGELDQYLFAHPDGDMLHPDHSMYTDDNAYFLAYEGDDVPLRVNNLINDLTSPPVASPFFLHTEAISYSDAFNDPYNPVSGGGTVSYSSYLHGEGFCKGAENNSTIQIPSLNRFNGGPDATIHIRLVSANLNNHILVIYFNDQLLDTLEARDFVIKDTSYVIPLGLLSDNNQLKVTELITGGRHCMVGIELTYPQPPTLIGFPQSSILLNGQPGVQHFIFDGFPHQGIQPLVYSHDGKDRMLAAASGQNQIEFVWPETFTDKRLDITDAAVGIKSITQLQEKQFVDFSADNTEYIIITHPDLMSIGTGSEYVQYRSSPEGGSYRAKAYSILDLYDQFGYGIQKHPQAIRNFVEFIHRHWSSAKMFFIIGRAIEYNKSRYAGTGWESFFFVPTFGRPGSDQLLTATNWNILARYPIGRLGITNSAAINTYLNKIREYDNSVNGDQTLEDKAWIKNVIHIGGGMDADEQGGFKFQLASLGDQLAKSDFGAKVSFFQKQSTDIIGESQSKQLEKLLHEGSTIINYLGHSSTSTFEFNVPDPSDWNNKGRYPIFSAMGCSAGAMHGTVQSLSDRFIGPADEGVIAFVSGSGSQFPGALYDWAEPWYDYIGGFGYEGTLGESILHGLRNISNSVNIDLNNSNPSRYLLEQQTLQGDPAIQFHPLPGPDYLVDAASVSITPEVLNTKQDSFDLHFSISNIGRNIPNAIGYSVKIKWPDGQEKEVSHAQIQSTTFQTAVSLHLPLNTNKKPGAYRLLITLDPDHLIDELPSPQAEDNNELKDNLGTIGVPFVVVDNVISAVYPPDFAIVNTVTPELISTSSNSFTKRQDIVMELDTTALFNSPAKIHEVFPGHSATLKWSPQYNYVPDRVYYWRVSTDSISLQRPYLWSKRSFIYKPGSPNGWNQSHFYQFTDDDLVQLVADSSKQNFKFGRQVKNFRMVNRYHNVDLGLTPLFYEDGVFNAKLSSALRTFDVTGFVVAIDSTTGKYMINPSGGLYGSVGLTIPMEGFAYNLKDPQSRQNMINLIENVIPAGYYVFFYTYQHQGFPDYEPQEWADDEATFGKSIFSVIEHQAPSSMIRTLATTGSKPYIILFQKDRGLIDEQIATTFDDIITVSFDGGASLSSGKFTSTLIGPASSWYSIENQISNLVDTAGLNVLSAYALNKSLTDTLWISHDLNNQVQSISDIDAKAYPYIQLSLTTGDSSAYKPSQINFWRVYYEGYPEFIINPDEGFVYVADSLLQGQKMTLSTYVENLSPYDVDSIPVSLRIISGNNTTQELNYKIPQLNAHTSAPVEFEKVTDQMSGDYQVLMEVNPGSVVNELNAANNIGILPLHVEGDVLNPVLDVTFDGHHILDGDLVASKPVIAVQLHDENQFLRLDDTSSFAMFLSFPSDVQPRRITFSEDWVQFNQASGSGQNTASVELRPDLLEDGIYTLQIKAKDASGNLAGANDFLITFEVINAKSVSHLYNYPNPFSTSTRFVYTLTGSGSPSYYKIQIMSMTGRIVREITQDEIGPLAVGTHMTDFAWDGSDEAGGQLAAGTYLYRLIVKDENLKDFDLYRTSGDDTFFRKGWGKLVIIR
ncbi:MAG: C25 family cysteine peptidase [Saprospiraceae bacterium]